MLFIIVNERRTNEKENEKASENGPGKERKSEWEKEILSFDRLQTECNAVELLILFCFCFGVLFFLRLFSFCFCFALFCILSSLVYGIVRSHFSSHYSVYLLMVLCRTRVHRRTHKHNESVAEKIFSRARQGEIKTKKKIQQSGVTCRIAFIFSSIRSTRTHPIFIILFAMENLPVSTGQSMKYDMLVAIAFATETEYKLLKKISGIFLNSLCCAQCYYFTSVQYDIVDYFTSHCIEDKRKAQQNYFLWRSQFTVSSLIILFSRECVKEIINDQT